MAGEATVSGWTRALVRRLAVLAMLVALFVSLTGQRLGVGALPGPAEAIEDVHSLGPLEGVETPPPTGQRPNIVIITTDDQNADELRWMPRTRALLADAGMTFSRALSPHPLCCPARAELLTGQYAQNNGVQHNHGRHGGWKAFHPRHTLPVWLRDSGYRTAMVGKFINEYFATDTRPPGWTIWNPMVAGVYNYYGTSFIENGRPRVRRGDSIDVVRDHTNSYIRHFAGPGRPFFIWSSQVAPHASSAGTGRWRPPEFPRRFATHRPSHRVLSLGKPSFGDADDTDQSACQCVATSPDAALVRDYELHRGQNLRAVDEAVASTIRTLADTGELENTYVIFSSDNGFLLGEHGLVGKNVLYQEALHVPLLVRGPGVLAGSHSGVPVTWVDLAPTIADLAGAVPTREVDGASFLDVLKGGPVDWRDTQLVQTGRVNLGGWEHRGVRTRRYTFAVSALTGATLLFDRRRDPFELVNRARDPAYADVRSELLRRTRLLEGCAGRSCRESFGPLPAVTGE